MPPSPSSEIRRYGPDGRSIRRDDPSSMTAAPRLGRPRSRSELARASSCSESTHVARRARRDRRPRGQRPPALRRRVDRVVEDGLDLFPASGVHQRTPDRRAGRGPPAAQLAREPGLRGAPIAQHRRLRDAKQFGDLGNLEATEEAALDHLRLARADAREPVERVVERKELLAQGQRPVDRLREGDLAGVAAALLGVPPARGLDEDLPHRPRSDALEMERRGERQAGRRRELHPGLVDQPRRIQRCPRVRAAHRRRQPPKFLVGKAEQAVQRVGLRPVRHAGDPVREAPRPGVTVLPAPLRIA